MGRFRVTYEIITPESAEHGDCAESGYVEPLGWKFQPGNESPEGLTLREATNLVSCVENSGRWFTEIDGRTDYRTANEERRSLHPPANITRASYARLARLLRAR
jgi:hypothetical protein